MKRIPLYEQYRPHSLADFAGNVKAVDQVSRLIQGGIGGHSFFISGPSGTGKTTLARIIAESIADPQWGTVELPATLLTAETLRDWMNHCWKYGWGKGGKAFIVNEAHKLDSRMIVTLLDWLENLPSHCVVIFTTTQAGEDKLFDDQSDASPLLSRCQVIRLTNQGTRPAFAARLHFIADQAGLNGMPESAYLALVDRTKGPEGPNMRAALQEIEAGKMVGGAA